MRRLVVIAVFFLSSAVMASPLPAPARAEVDALLNKLQSSGCEFQRNGSWYTGNEAHTHLLRKLDYLEGKDLVKTTAQFIEKGASTSSSSGKPYQVRCGATAAMDSDKWLTAELKAMRVGPR